MRTAEVRVQSMPFMQAVEEFAMARQLAESEEQWGWAVNGEAKGRTKGA